MVNVASFGKYSFIVFKCQRSGECGFTIAGMFFTGI